MNELLPNVGAGFKLEPSQQEQARMLLYDNDNYTAYTEDLEFMWRWTIYQDEKLIQEGCSLSLNSSRDAVNHVLAYFKLTKPKK